MPEYKNMCDGCERKLPIVEGMHKEPSTYGWTYCTKDRYVPTEEKHCAGCGTCLDSGVTSGEECVSKRECACHFYPSEERTVTSDYTIKLVPTTDQEVDIWEKEFFGKFGANKIWVAPSKDNVETIHDIWAFISQVEHSAIERERERVERIIEENSIFLSHHAFPGEGLVPIVKSGTIKRLLTKDTNHD